MKRYHLISLAVILSVYFLFTSGILFEAAQVKDIARFQTPYNVALSGWRIDLYGNWTEDDVKVRKWLEGSDIPALYSDFYGVIFLQELISYEKDVYFIPEDFEIPVGSIVFLRSWTNTHQELCFWTGSGTRKSVPFGGYEGSVVYQSGDSKVIKAE